MTLTCDTSVLVPALATWHPHHQRASRVLTERVTALGSHVVLETYAVLTRLPAPGRVAPEIASRAVAGLKIPLVGLPPGAASGLVARLGREGIRGGATYDALVAETARHHDLLLVTADRRARRTYESLGVRFEVLATE